MTSGVSLQISLTPTDFPHAQYVLPHQLRQWAGQVDEVLLVIDAVRSRGRFGDEWDKRLPKLRALVAECLRRYRHARSADVDYGAATSRQLSGRFFGGARVPAKDWLGGPFYAYFFGLHLASYPYVIHMDSDMIYGGGSQHWVREAVSLLRARPDVLCCSPLPGPPTADGGLRSQHLDREPMAGLAYWSAALSSRHFLIDTDRFAQRIGRLKLSRPQRWRVLRAWAEGHPPFALAEVILSKAMTERGLIRVEFLGSAPGMWGVHPLYRTDDFYRGLPRLIDRIESNDIPDGQRGDHELNDSMVDWTGVKKTRRRRVAEHLKLMLNR